MTMLRFWRAVLLVVVSIWFGAIVAGVSGLITPAAAMLFGAYSFIGLGLAAAACVVAQIVLIRRHP